MLGRTAPGSASPLGPAQVERGRTGQRATGGPRWGGRLHCAQTTRRQSTDGAKRERESRWGGGRKGGASVEPWRKGACCSDGR